MKRKTNQNTDAILDRVTEEIRTERIDSALVDSAANRAWAKLSTASVEARVAVGESVEHIHGCSDFQSLMPAYLRGELQSARALLLKDHTHECIPCRRALKLASEGKVATVETSQPRVQSTMPMIQPVWKWAIAASLIAGITLLALPLIQRFLPFGNSVHATVQAANGPVY